MAPEPTVSSFESLTDQEYLEVIRRAREESVRFFSSNNKAERETWVAREFLVNLGISAGDDELVSVTDDPPDIIYRECRFEIKEILDPGRRRSDEFKQGLAQAYAATSPSQLTEHVEPRDIAYREVEQLALEATTKLKDKYAPQTKSSLDLLFYVNLADVFGYVSQPLSKTLEIEACGFRSVLLLAGPLSAVVACSQDTPSLLAAFRGQVVRRDSRNGAI
jgi:hypothetical protein